ncbi:hypothetical protein PsYK624_031860 [Phanerochaete sordida]|uniref:Uncharacterized protein n=1 Tax=Phanerochaete sordida TaxID=48140 RepID=A0A9P3LAL0_9APHY|nr:hypothetical protein PsYK624_031860 [Phanerochaete sordida]
MSAALVNAQAALTDLFAANEHLLHDFDVSLLSSDALAWLQTCKSQLLDVWLPDLQQRILALDLPRHSTALRSAELFWLYSLSALSALVLVPVLLLHRRAKPESPRSPRLRAPLDALLGLVTPTTSVWPAPYRATARHSIAGPAAALAVPVSRLLADVVGGSLELCGAAELQRFVAGTLERHGWRIVPRVGLAWRVYVVCRIACMCAAAWRPSIFHRTANVDTMPVKLSRLTAPDKAAPALHKLAPDMTMLSLDAVPFSKLESHIRALQRSLPPGSSAVVGFSTRGGSMSYLSTAFVQASIPYFARRHAIARPAPPGGGIAPTLGVEPAPLLTSLDRVLRLLAHGGAALSVESVQNVSAQYASFLERYVQELTEQAAVRARFVARWGMAGWREERLLVAWEAATFRAGLMSRWAVYVTRKA